MVVPGLNIMLDFTCDKNKTRYATLFLLSWKMASEQVFLFSGPLPGWEWYRKVFYLCQSSFPSLLSTQGSTVQVLFLSRNLRCVLSEGASFLGAKDLVSAGDQFLLVCI